MAHPKLILDLRLLLMILKKNYIVHKLTVLWLIFIYKLSRKGSCSMVAFFLGVHWGSVSLNVIEKQRKILFGPKTWHLPTKIRKIRFLFVFCLVSNAFLFRRVRSLRDFDSNFRKKNQTDIRRDTIPTVIRLPAFDL